MDCQSCSTWMHDTVGLPLVRLLRPLSNSKHLLILCQKEYIYAYYNLGGLAMQFCSFFLHVWEEACFLCSIFFFHITSSVDMYSHMVLKWLAYCGELGVLFFAPIYTNVCHLYECTSRLALIEPSTSLLFCVSVAVLCIIIRIKHTCTYTYGTCTP
jgi:hypothetical protein